MYSQNVINKNSKFFPTFSLFIFEKMFSRCYVQIDVNMLFPLLPLFPPFFSLKIKFRLSNVTSSIRSIPPTEHLTYASCLFFLLFEGWVRSISGCPTKHDSCLNSFECSLLYTEAGITSCLRFTSLKKSFARIYFTLKLILQ